MTNNYPYIVAGLPDLLLDFAGKPFDGVKIRSALKEQISPKEQRWIAWLEFGLQSDRLGAHFYRAASKLHNSFIRDYFAFDLEMRRILASVRSHTPRTGWERSELATFLFSILETGNILEREQKLDQLRWNKANELCTFHYFSIEVILCFLLKLSIVERWIGLDKVRGQELFNTLVQEIKETPKNHES